MKRLLLLFALWKASAFAAGSPDIPAVLTLPQALEIALANSTNIQTAITQLEQATGQYQQYRSPLLPQLDLHARQSLLTVNLIGAGVPVLGETGRIGPFGSMDSRIFLTQEVFNLADRRAWKSAKARQDSSRFLVQNARELVALNVVATYLEALRSKATRDSLAAQGTLADDLYKLTRDRVTQGVAAELEANRAMQQVNALLQQRQEAEQSYIMAKFTLANILHARVTSNYEVADPAAYGAGGPPDHAATIQAALASRADYHSLQANVKAAELQLKSARAEKLPTLSLGASDGQSGNSPVHNVNVYSVSGFVDFPIFNGGRIRGEAEEAEGALSEARTALEQSRSQIETDVLASISGVEWALKEVETSEKNVKLSQQEVELARQRFTQGIADNTEVVNAQDRLERAADARIRAEFTLGLARADLARASGGAEKTYRR
ncbi:MAG TPA: TolC family protein [Bryobacteraceae bacterium]|jgi:outer membrane protein TolC